MTLGEQVADALVKREYGRRGQGRLLVAGQEVMEADEDLVADTSDHLLAAIARMIDGPLPPLSVGIARLSLQPGDVLVVTLPGKPSQSHTDSVGRQIEPHLPEGVKVMVKPEGVTLTVLRAGQPVAPTVDEAVTVEVPR